MLLPWAFTAKALVTRLPLLANIIVLACFVLLLATILFNFWTVVCFVHIPNGHGLKFVSAHNFCKIVRESFNICQIEFRCSSNNGRLK